MKTNQAPASSSLTFVCTTTQTVSLGKERTEIEQKARAILERQGNVSRNAQLETHRSPGDLIAELGVVSPLLRVFVAPSDSLADFECYPPGLRPDLEAAIVPGDDATTLDAVRKIFENS